ncbi:MAG: glycoside hydrolase family 2 TIM barrel-domain containing protein [Bacteroidales bacterium]
MRNFNLITLIPVLFMVTAMMSCSKSTDAMNEKILLKDNWRVQRSKELINLPGSFISGTVIDTSLWFPAQVPSTIMGVLTGNGLFKDLFYDDSLKRVNKEPFEDSWWYRTEFRLPRIKEEQQVMLNFDGISYYANIWLNGVLIASRDSVYGTFRRFEFNITGLIQDTTNILAVEVFKQQPGDFGHGFVDWNPPPPDDNMGIWREVYLKITGDVALKNTVVQTDVNTETLDEASLTIKTEVINYSQRAVSGKLIGKSEDFEFSIPVHLKAGERKQVTLNSDEISDLHIQHPRLWWCNNMGTPNLYNLSLKYETNNSVSDEQNITYGIREVETYLNNEGHRGFKLNGKELLIQGAGWTDDIFLRDTEERNEIQVRYVRHMNLNTIRFENIWGTSQHIYDLCDRYGILAMVGWSCQWEWENYLGKPCDDFGGIKTIKDMDLMVESLEHQIRYLQNHPAIFVWMLGSDKLPRPALEKRYLDLIRAIDDRPGVSAASKRSSKISGPTGVKMNGPYNYVGPSYWYIDSVNGGAFGFNTETGPGPQLPVLESIKKMLPEEKLWPVNESWNYHCNPSESFQDLKIFSEVMDNRYGQANNLESYLMKANVQSYETIRGMFEAFRTNRPNTTGIIQWMLNSAWPSFYWQLYDYYLLPTPAYYAVKKANEPLQLIYNYGNHTVYAVNSTLKRYANARAGYRMFDLQGKELFSDEQVVKLEENQSSKLFKLPANYSTVFLKLSLLDENNSEIAENFYWLAGKPDVYDWEKTNWFYTPVKYSADLKSLNYLPAAEVEVNAGFEKSDELESLIKVTLTNKSNRVAFFTCLTVRNSNNETIRPVFWNDNYVSLLPGESEVLQCLIPGSQLPENTELLVSGWNVKEQTVKLTVKTEGRE